MIDSSFQEHKFKFWPYPPSLKLSCWTLNQALWQPFVFCFVQLHKWKKDHQHFNRYHALNVVRQSISH